jgi:Tol biopolymer transport system component
MRLSLGLAIALVVAIAVPAADASFPGRNGRIVFVSYPAASPGQPAQDGDLFTIGADGRRLKTLTSNRSNELWPKWSPGGKRLVFSRYANAANVYALHVVRADGSGLKKITSQRGMNDISRAGRLPGGGLRSCVRPPTRKAGIAHVSMS